MFGLLKPASRVFSGAVRAGHADELRGEPRRPRQRVGGEVLLRMAHRAEALGCELRAQRLRHLGAAELRPAQCSPRLPAAVHPTPATHAIRTQLKAREAMYQADELHKIL